MIPVKRSHWAMWLKQFVAALVVLCLVWFVVRHWHSMCLLLNLSAINLVCLYLLYCLVALATAWIGNSLLSILGVRASLSEMFLLQNAVFLLNYTPMKYGSFFRANYLKKHHGLSFGRFGTLSLVTTFLVTIGSALSGILSLTFVYGWDSPQKVVLGLSLVAVFLVSMLVLFFPLPNLGGEGNLARLSTEFKTGRQLVQVQPRALIECTLMSIATFVLTSLRLWMIFESLGQSIHPAGYLILGAIGYAAMFLSLTPGGLGVREFLLGAVSTVLGIPLETGILAAMIDRGVVMTYAFLAGGTSLLILQRFSLFRPNVNSSQ